MCRDAYVPTDGASSCDIAETCDGISAFCPSDSMKVCFVYFICFICDISFRTLQLFVVLLLFQQIQKFFPVTLQSIAQERPFNAHLIHSRFFESFFLIFYH